MRLQTAEGKREIWGKDLKRAVTESLSQPKIGDEVVLQRTGRKAVTVRRPTKDDQGELREQPYATFRNRWTLETREFFERRSAAAQVVRDVSVRPQDVDNSPFANLPDDKKSRWGAGITAEEMREMQWTSPQLVRRSGS